MTTVPIQSMCHYKYDFILEHESKKETQLISDNTLLF